MTTEIIVQLFVGVAIMGVVSSLLQGDNEDDDPPDGGMMQPAFEGV